MTHREAIKKIGLPIGSVLVFVGIWALAAAIVGAEIILPSPGAVVVSCGAMLASGTFWQAIGWSVLRALAAFGISFAAALVCSVLGALSDGVAAFVSPIVTILRSVPTISVIFIVMVFLPSGRVPVLIGFLIVFPMLYEGFLSGMRSVDRDFVTLSEVYRVPVSTRILRCYLPATLPAVFSVSRSAIGLTLKIVVAAEAIASTRLSLGRLLQSANIRIESGELFAYTIAAIAVSFLLEGLVLLLEKCVVRWPV